MLLRQHDPRGRGDHHPLHRSPRLRQGLRRFRSTIAATRRAPRYVRGRPAKIEQVAGDGDPRGVRRGHTGGHASERLEADLVVLSVAAAPNDGAVELAETLGIETDRVRLHRPVGSGRLGGRDDARRDLCMRQRRGTAGHPRLRGPGLGRGGPCRALPRRPPGRGVRGSGRSRSTSRARRASVSLSATAASTSPACSTSRSWRNTRRPCPTCCCRNGSVRLLQQRPGSAGRADPRAPAEPCRSRCLHAAHPRADLPGDLCLASASIPTCSRWSTSATSARGCTRRQPDDGPGEGPYAHPHGRRAGPAPRAARRRARSPMTRAALVIGGGIAGIQAATDLARPGLPGHAGREGGPARRAARRPPSQAPLPEHASGWRGSGAANWRG